MDAKCTFNVQDLLVCAWGWTSEHLVPLTLLAYLGNHVPCVTCGMWCKYGERHIVAWSRYPCSIPRKYAEVFSNVEEGGKKLLM